MTVDEIRELFLRFFRERGHKVYPSDSLTPANDPTLLFTGAGMNQFKEEFMGRVKGPKRAATCQKCLRTGDLENVGRTPDHHTFFEMLGNFSFGDYFKKDAIAWAWEFLTKTLGLKEKDLWVSVYKDDDETYRIWKDDIKVPLEKIMKLGAKDNFWPANAPADGPNGPCGPCSEIFFGGPDGVEVWNLVFTQFDRKDGGRLDPLPNKNIDTGMGLERIARVLQGKKTNFEIDSFLPIIDAIKRVSRVKDGEARRLNAIADHIRAVTFSIGDGVMPSNEERGYVIRKLIRKAYWYGMGLGLQEPFLYKLVPAVVKVMKKPYPELGGQMEDIAQVVLAEEERFRNTLHDGLERLEAMIDGVKSSGVLPGPDIFKLYDTYGFPPELTREIAQDRNIKSDIKCFDRCMEEQRVKSKKTSKIKGSIFEVKGDAKIKLPEETIFIEDKESIETEILQVSGDSIFLKETNFYGEKGGQVGDTGWIIKEGSVAADVIDALDVAGRIQHKIKIKKGLLDPGDKVTARIDLARRNNIKKNHTATHLLHNALRQVLGQHVKQAGSLVAPDRLRFDFTHFKALTDDDILRIEELVNDNIQKDSAVCVKEMSIDEAGKHDAIALFGEKYGDTVRMVAVGDYSKELCGGTHVDRTKEVGVFKIMSESSVASGVRRIEAITGEAAGEKIKKDAELIKEIAKELKTTPDNILNEIGSLSVKLKTLETELANVSNRFVNANIDSLLKTAEKIKDADVIVSEIKNADMALLRKTADAIKARLKKVVFVLVSEKDKKISMVVGAYAPINASAILNEIGSEFGIKGGGRPEFAQAGGSTSAKVEDIVKKAEEIAKRYI